MKEPCIVSPETMLRYDRDLHALKVAQANLYESWQAVLRQQYGMAECADAKAPPETET